MRATLKLLNSYFWKTYYGPILAFIFPVILLGILGNIFRIEYVYPGIIAMSFLFIGLLSLPLAIMELKQSSLFKYIGSSPVNPIKFSITIILFYVFMAIITAIIILISTIAIFFKQVFPDAGFKHGILGGIFTTFKGASSFYVSVFVHLIFVIVFGLLISTLSKTPQQSLTTGLIILIPSMFLSGMILSVDIIGQSPLLNWISRLIPFRYTTGNIVISSTPIDQIGDMFQILPRDQKILIFRKENVNPDGSVTLQSLVQQKNFVVHSMEELKHAQMELGNIEDALKDKHLYDLTFGVALQNDANYSDNNIFMWKHPWSVRRIPQVDLIQAFIKDYFGSFRGSGGSTDWSKLEPIAGQIAKGEFGWLDIFMKQTNVLYTKADRVLNLMLPLSLSVAMLWYISKNFNWSAR